MTALPQPAQGLFDGPLHRYAVNVYYEDTDAGGVVYHANYLRWFERARTDILRLFGIDQRAASEAGEGTYVVVGAEMKFHAPARLGDVVIIESSCESAQSASVKMHQRAVCDNRLLVDARIRVGFVGPDGRPRRQPRAWLDKFATLTGETEG